MSEMVERVMKALQLYGTGNDYQMARAAIKAMRKPTERMVWAATASTSGDGTPDGDYDEDVRCHWHAMIDEALK